MANVYTKRGKIPRTTTLCDFGFYSQALKMLRQCDMQNNEAEVHRVLSPTRRQNPQPVGLVYQSPYNRNNQVFGIWNPDPLVPVVRCRETLPHLRRTNFTCRPDPEFLGKRMLPSDLTAPVIRKEPEIKYTYDTVQRQCYAWPEKTPEKYEGMVKRTRFGHTCRNNACQMCYPKKSQTKCTSKQRMQTKRESKNHRSPDKLLQLLMRINPSTGLLPVSLPIHKKGKKPKAKNHSTCCEKIKIVL